MYPNPFLKLLAFSFDYLLSHLMLLPFWIWFIRGLIGPESGIFLLGYGIFIPFLWILFRCVYLTVSWTWRGMTLGGLIFNHRVVTAQKESVTWKTAILRFLVLSINWLTLGIACMYMLMNDKRIGLHDLIANTVVIHTENSRSENFSSTENPSS